MNKVLRIWAAVGWILLTAMMTGGVAGAHGQRIPSRSGWRALDSTGTYWCRADEAGGELPTPRPAVSPARFDPAEAVRCRLVDLIDCRRNDHGFVDDGKSRVWHHGGRWWRLTDHRRDLSWFSYVLHCRAKPGRPQLLVAELLNDRERYTTLTLTAPEGFVWASPYAGEESFKPANMEGDGVRQDIGTCVYTGREFPCDGKPFLHSFLFYPKCDRIKLTVSHSGVEEHDDPFNGAAVSRVWVFDVVSEQLPPALPPGAPRSTAGGRRLGLYVPHAWYLYGHYGLPARTRDQRVASLQAFVEYLRFCGVNLLEFHVINGSDTASRAWYEGSKFYRPLQGDLLAELLPLCEAADIQVVPLIAPIFPPREALTREKPDEHGFCRLSFQHDRDGKSVSGGMNKPAPDPLRPEVQQWLFGCLREIGDRCKRFRCVPGIGFRVNGKIGLCYLGDKLDHRAQWTGYSPWDLEEFRRDTGIGTPAGADAPHAYAWLRTHAWNEWLNWRCRRTHAFWLAARDLLRDLRPDWNLVVACDLPSETPGVNVEWPEGTPVRRLLKYHGYDPVLFTAADGIVLQRAMMINSDRFFCKWGPPHGSNPGAHKAFHYESGAAACYRTRAFAAVELYHNYWEEAPHPDNEFGPTLRTANGAPWGRNVLEPALFSLRAANVRWVTFMGWERATAGSEALLRRFARTWRQLPVGPVSPFSGEVRATPLTPAPVPAHAGARVWARVFGGVLAVVNETAVAQQVSVVTRNRRYQRTLAPWELWLPRQSGEAGKEEAVLP